MTAPEPEQHACCTPVRFLAEIAVRFAALGENKRLGIISSLACGEQCACDLTSCCGERQPLLSFHLKRLREAGLVKTRREGRSIHYTLDRQALRDLADALLELADHEITVNTT